MTGKLYLVRLQCLNVVAGGPDELSFAYVYADSEEEAKKEASDGMCFAIDAAEVGE
ncbi:hypothetical protein YN1551_3189 (plasmid) [Sulfolobus islandicus Y.N.15.51]|jgi:hypothetical protein|uniref:Uncharacterized protein n=1 Tax=Saccharolobus islandicus (strain Y.N.15.51 / Yellowstone \|nr:hypothetical protein [Sulfolobus islandicus]ACP48479.1 hypothetical protein YN1551_1386 [Sulfolobus islandicus Y.N.15.51]ACP50065.1 hypothetical protein YN1551_3189 [Sulfolobus islandicus Y.N.15.51]